MGEEYTEFVNGAEIELARSTDECDRLIEETNKVKGGAAMQVVGLQNEVVKLQRELLAEKDKQLSELRTSVVQSVGETVKAELKSYSEIVKQSCQSPPKNVSQASLKSVVQTVFEEKDRSKNLIIFGLTEKKDEVLQEKVGKVLLALEQKPKFTAIRIGSSKVSGDKPKARPVRLRMESSNAAREVLSHAKRLRLSLIHI